MKIIYSIFILLLYSVVWGRNFYYLQKRIDTIDRIAILNTNVNSISNKMTVLTKTEFDNAHSDFLRAQGKLSNDTNELLDHSNRYERGNYSIPGQRTHHLSDANRMSLARSHFDILEFDMARSQSVLDILSAYRRIDATKNYEIAQEIDKSTNLFIKNCHHKETIESLAILYQKVFNALKEKVKQRLKILSAALSHADWHEWMKYEEDQSRSQNTLYQRYSTKQQDALEKLNLLRNEYRKKKDNFESLKKQLEEFISANEVCT